MLTLSATLKAAQQRYDVEPRLTLADALRHRLGLTGTHLGCEHGVCGACTVLVDGAAARSCLLFCVQLDGAEITTVEALGTPEARGLLEELQGSVDSTGVPRKLFAALVGGIVLGLLGGLGLLLEFSFQLNPLGPGWALVPGMILQPQQSGARTGRVTASVTSVWPPVIATPSLRAAASRSSKSSRTSAKVEPIGISAVT